MAQRRPVKQPPARRRPRYSAARRRRRLVLVALVLVIVIPGALLVALAAGSDGSPRGGSRPGLTVAALEAYQAAVHPPLADGGRVVERGMKPAVGTLAEPGADGARVAADAKTWVRTLGEVRAKVAAVPPPPDLAAAAAAFDRALVLYADAARDLGRAARAAKADRARVLDEAVAKAREADRTYDDGSRVLQDWRRRLGLGPTGQFPDPATSPSG